GIDLEGVGDGGGQVEAAAGRDLGAAGQVGGGGGVGGAEAEAAHGGDSGDGGAGIALGGEADVAGGGERGGAAAANLHRGLGRRGVLGGVAGDVPREAGVVAERIELGADDRVVAGGAGLGAEGDVVGAEGGVADGDRSDGAGQSFRVAGVGIDVDVAAAGVEHRRGAGAVEAAVNGDGAALDGDALAGEQARGVDGGAELGRAGGDRAADVHGGGLNRGGADGVDLAQDRNQAIGGDGLGAGHEGARVPGDVIKEVGDEIGRWRGQGERADVDDASRANDDAVGIGEVDVAADRAAAQQRVDDAEDLGRRLAGAINEVEEIVVGRGAGDIEVDGGAVGDLEAAELVVGVAAADCAGRDIGGRAGLGDGGGGGSASSHLGGGGRRRQRMLGGEGHGQQDGKSRPQPGEREKQPGRTHRQTHPFPHL